MKKHLAIEYSDDFPEVRQLDLFLPEDSNGRAILWIHGGGWRAGSRAGWHGPAEYFADKGYVCASCDYRLAPDSHWPAAMEDVRLAMRWFRERADEYGFSASRVAAAGSSAGGHLVAMLATVGADDSIGATSELGHYDTRPDAGICYCPATTVLRRDVPILAEAISDLMGGAQEDMPEAYRQASPLELLSGKEPPMLFLHGDDDQTVPFDESKDMYDGLIERGVPAELITLEGVGHGFGYGVESDPQKRSLIEIERFLDIHLVEE